MRALLPRARRLLRERERGASAIVLLAFAGPLLLATGLVWDASTKITAAQHAQGTAQEAARAAAQQLTGQAILGQVGTPDPARAVTAGQAYLAAAGQSGTVTVAGDSLVVTTTEPWQARFFPGGGVATGTATVRLAAVTP